MTNEKTTPSQAPANIENPTQPIRCSMSCYVCGMDDWCGTDGCPFDPQ